MTQATFDQYLRLGVMIKDGSLDREWVQAIIEGRISLTVVEKKYRAHVVYVQPSYADLRKVFDQVNCSYERSKFKVIDVCEVVLTSARKMEFELVHLNMVASTDEALAELDRRSLRPALYEELLAFMEECSDHQKQFPIVALGSVCHYSGRLCSPYVHWDEDGRCLDIDWIGYNWHSTRRFLAVRK